MTYPIQGSSRHYHDDPTLADVLFWANRWINLPKGQTVDMHDEDQKAYNEDRPFAGPMVAVNWLLDNDIVRWTRTGKTRPSGWKMLGFRLSGVYVLERVYNWDTVDVRCARDLDYRRLLQTCTKCGTEFLCYKPMDKRRYCSSECQRRRKNRDYQRRRRLTQREECATMSHGHSTDGTRPGDGCAQ